MTSRAPLPGAPAERSLSGTPASGQPQQASVKSFRGPGGPGVRFGKARHAGTGGLVLLEGRTQCSETHEGLEKMAQHWHILCGLAALGCHFNPQGSAHMAHSTTMATVNIPCGFLH